VEHADPKVISSANPRADAQVPSEPMATKRSVRKSLWLTIVSLVAFFVCAVLVVTKVTAQWDQSTFVLLNDFAPNTPFVNTVMIAFSQYGREIVWPVLTVLLIFSKNQSHRRTAFYFLVTILATIVPGYAAQYGVNRLRPDLVISGAHELVTPLVAPSFPSGHALVVFAGVAVVFFTWKNRKAGALLTLDAALVTFARVYVGAHFPMDAIAGIFLGIAIGSAVMVFRPRLDPLILRLDRKWKAKVVDRMWREKNVGTEGSTIQGQSGG
jgi:membrane-associated phospholipid phosphatase